MRRILAVASGRIRRTIRTTFKGFLTGSALLATVACSGADGGTGPRPNTDQGTPGKTAGLYALTTIDKKQIPLQVFRGRYYYEKLGYTFDDMSITVTGGELALLANGQFRMLVELRFAANGGEDQGSRSFNGQYKVNGTELVLTDGGGSVSGTIAKDLVWVNLDPGPTGATKTYYFKLVP
jgi:hypothetical protein